MNYKKWIIIFQCFIVLSFACYELMNLRNFQISGEIYDKIITNDKFVALTFDDGPQPLYTDLILSILSKENVRCTFYLTGAEIKLNLNEAVKIIRAGHEIGNHSYSHNRMVFKSWNKIKTEIEDTDHLIRSAGYTGQITFRPPYCKKFIILPLYLKKNNRISITWNIEPDSVKSSNKAPDMAGIVNKEIKPGSIILLHVMNKERIESMASVEPIIKSLKSKGYTFLTISELMKHKND